MLIVTSSYSEYCEKKHITSNMGGHVMDNRFGRSFWEMFVGTCLLVTGNCFARTHTMCESSSNAIKWQHLTVMTAASAQPTALYMMYCTAPHRTKSLASHNHQQLPLFSGMR